MQANIHLAPIFEFYDIMHPTIRWIDRPDLGRPITCSLLPFSGRADEGFCRVRSVGLTAADVGIKISTRSVLAELLPSLGVPEENFAATCVLVDKLDKLPQDEVRRARGPSLGG